MIEKSAVIEIAERIKPLIDGKPPELVATVLAAVTAAWIRSKSIPGDPGATERMRAGLYLDIIGAVAEMAGFELETGRIPYGKALH